MDTEEKFKLNNFFLKIENLETLEWLSNYYKQSGRWKGHGHCGGNKTM